jgi:hypothetical protein
MTATVAPDFVMSDPPVLTRLLVAGRETAQYRSGVGLDARLSPRPYLHPVRTLAGTVVTAALPADHRWHLGAGVAVQDVGGVNVWGGRTYLRGTGYRWLGDHGRVDHVAFRSCSESGFGEELTWRSPDGRDLLSERRDVSAESLPRLPAGGWQLRLRFRLCNVTGSPLELGSPGSNGRDAGGYGGFFWRLPALLHAQVRTAEATGEAEVHARPATWLTVRGRTLSENAEVTLVFRPADVITRQDPWFVRLASYPGVGSSLAARHPVRLEPGESLTRALDVLVLDGTVGDADLPALAGEGVG